MKKMMLNCMMLLAILLFTACNNDQVDPTPVDEDSESNMQTEIESRDVEPEDEEEDSGDELDSSNEQAQNQEDMQKMMEQLDFHEFKLEVEYENDKDYTVEIEHHSDGRIDAEVEDELQDVFIKDDVDAFNYLFPLVSKLNVTKDMAKEDLIAHVLDVFELDANYKEFEVEFEFNDGSELEVEDKR